MAPADDKSTDASSTPALAPGTIVGGRFEIREQLGTGGMGLVYRAFDRSLDQLVALKMLHADLEPDPALIASFRDEVKLARLEHFRRLRHAFLAPQDRFDSGHQFAGTKRLHHVIIRADLQPQNTVNLFPLGRKKNNRHRLQALVRAHPLADFQAVEVGQEDVENHQAGGMTA